MSFKILVILQIILFNPGFATREPEPPRPDDPGNCINREKPGYYVVIYNGWGVCDGALIRPDWVIMGCYCLKEYIGVDRQKSVRTALRPYQFRRVKSTSICEACGWGLLIMKSKFYNCQNVALIALPKLRESMPCQQAQYLYSTFKKTGNIYSPVCIKRVSVTIYKKEKCWKPKSFWCKRNAICGDKTGFKPSSKSCASGSREDEDPEWPDMDNQEKSYDDFDPGHKDSGQFRSHNDYPVDKDIDNIVYPIYPDTTKNPIPPDEPDIRPPKNKYCREICYDKCQTGGMLIFKGKVYGFLERRTCDCLKLAFSNLAMTVDQVRVKGRGRRENVTGDESQMEEESESSASDSKLSAKIMVVLVVVPFLTQTLS